MRLRFRWPAILAVAVIVAALGWVAVRGLTGSLVYFLTPSDVVLHQQAGVGERIRLGGQVVPGSVQHAAHDIRFVVTDGTTRMTVVDTGDVPELFRAGRGVVLEGDLGRDGAFHADTVLVRHNGVYRPPKPGEAPPETADLSSGG